MKKFYLLLLMFSVVPNFVFAQQAGVVKSTSPTESTELVDSTQSASENIHYVRGLEITPFLLDLDVEKGKEIKSQIDLTNRSLSPLIITVTPRDFLPGFEGQPEFVPDTQINDPTFSLASWINLESPTQFTIQPDQTFRVPFTLNPPVNAEDGTHYGALLFSYVGSSATGNASEIQQSVGTIILVRYGVGRENGTASLFANKKIMFNADKVTLENKFFNTGNVHVQPKGEVYVSNMWGKVVATPFVNRDAANVLPKTERTFINSWYPSSFAFGRYTLESVLTYGRTRLEAKDKVVIWVLPFYYLIAIGVALALVLWFIFHGRHWHKRRVIDRHYRKLENESSKQGQ